MKSEISPNNNSETREFFYEVSPLKNLGRDLDFLTYKFSEKISRGILVEISVGNKKSAGVVLSEVSKPKFACKNISRILFSEPLPDEILKLHKFISAFYSANSAAVWQTMLPAGILKKRREKNEISEVKPEQKIYSKSKIDKNLREISLTDAQKNALKILRKMPNGTAILRGITGSGKTEIYKNLARDAISRGQNVIILVPEISLTTQLVENFRENFAREADPQDHNILLTHSAQKETERAKIWLDALTSKRPIVAIGPRSALFLPLKNVGLIVIDECHEPTYRQEKSPRYDALRVAAKLCEIHNSADFDDSHSDNSDDFTENSREKSSGKNENSAKNNKSCKLILGSATPLISDVFVAEKLHRPIVEMTTLARENAVKSTTEIVDLTKRENFSSESKIFSKKLLSAIRETLAGKKQVLLFHNRRGTASTTLCENCGWISLCPRCYLPLTLHADKFELRCHICNFRAKVPTKCPECGGANILHKGIGTKKIEEEIKRIFPEIARENSDKNPADDVKTLRRFDGDTSRENSVAEIYDELKDGKTKIIIGTQQIAKGLDLPNLALVGVVQADAGLNLPDFSASERTFELIAQACGRVGRGGETSRAIIQTFQPSAPAVIFGAKQDFWNFYKAEISERKRGHFPPFAHILKLTCQYKTESGAVNAARKLAGEIRKNFGENIKILGPAPAFYERMRDNFRWQIIVRSNSREILREIASKIPPKNWSAEIDPWGLI